MQQAPEKAGGLPRERLIPLIVAVALFMENMDATVIATSLPAIARDIGTTPLALKLAVTSYLLSLAVFIPASGWTADRFGARSVFRGAIAVFMVGSIGCAMSHSLTDFVLARIVQGMGGAMMTPVGRLIMVRSVDRRALVAATTWLTMPALVGPVLGPPVGGFITTYATWHWIFLINIPIGLLGLYLVTRYIEEIRAEANYPFDLVGMVLAGLGMAGLAFGLSVMGLEFLPSWVVAALIGGGAVASIAYVLHARRMAAPVLDLSLFRLPTFRASVGGGFAFRIGVGAFPFLLPLLLQLGFDFTPFQSGMVTFAGALGAIGMKTIVPRILSWLGFRTVLTWNSLISAAFLAACAAFRPGTPVGVMIVVLLIGGFFRSLQFTSINSLAYADVDARRTSRATTLVSVAQQLAISTGVAVGALVVHATYYFHHGTEITAADFPPAFLFVSGVSAASVFVFARLPASAGAELAARRAAERAATPAAPAEATTEARDQRAS